MKTVLRQKGTLLIGLETELTIGSMTTAPKGYLKVVVVILNHTVAKHNILKAYRDNERNV
jgi:hypothetical protein